MTELPRFEERRKFPRVDIEVPMEYRRLRSAPDLRKGSVSKNLSAAGVRFTTDEFISFTERFVLEVVLPLPQRPFSTVSKISWIRKLPMGDTYEVGSQFLEIAKPDRERLSNYIQGLLSAAV